MDNEKLILFTGKKFTDIVPVCLGEEYCKPGKVLLNQMRNFYLFHYIVSGKGKFTVDGKSYEVGPGDVFFMKEQQFADYIADEKDPWHYIWVGFSGIYARKLKQLDTPVFKIDSNIFLEMNEVDNKKYSMEEFVVGKIYTLISMITHEEDDDDYVTRAINYIHYQPKLDVNEISKELYMERHYLSKLFKKKTGMTMQEYLLNHKIFVAKRYLEMNLSILEISELLGYSDQFSFSKIFKKKTGLSPLQYKKTINNKNN